MSPPFVHPLSPLCIPLLHPPSFPLRVPPHIPPFRPSPTCSMSPWSPPAAWLRPQPWGSPAASGAEISATVIRRWECGPRAARFIFSSASRGVTHRPGPSPAGSGDPAPGCSAGDVGSWCQPHVGHHAQGAVLEFRDCWGSGWALEVAVPSLPQPPLTRGPQTAATSPARRGAMDSDRLCDTTWQWGSSPVAEAPRGLCAQPCPAQTTRTRGTLSCFPLHLPTPPTPARALGSVPSIPRDAYPGSATREGQLAPRWIILLFPFSAAEKFKNHKIIFVVGKSVSRSCHWWGRGHGPALSPSLPGWGLWETASAQSWAAGG